MYMIKYSSDIKCLRLARRKRLVNDFWLLCIVFMMRGRIKHSIDSTVYDQTLRVTFHIPDVEFLAWSHVILR